MALNATLCEAAAVPHEVRAERHEEVRKLWETMAAQETDLPKALDTLRECIRQAPFRYLNLNTFSGVARTLVEGPGRNLAPVEARILSSTVKQYVESKVGKGELLQVLRHFAGRMRATPDAAGAPAAAAPGPRAEPRPAPEPAPAPAPVRTQPQTT